MKRDGVVSFLHAILLREQANTLKDGVEVYCLFGENDNMLVLHVGPLVSLNPEIENDAAPGEADQSFDSHRHSAD